jgi:hypothetical protein
MVAGHYAMSLVAYERQRQGPLWLFLFAGIFLDLLMIGLVLAGVEVMAPPPGAVRPHFASMVVDMSYSHDVVPVVVWAAAMAAFAYVVTRNRAVALWAAGLVVVHEVADFVSGFSHFIHGPGTAEVGLGLYGRAPLAALGVELLVAVACVWWFGHRTQLSARRRLALYALAVGGVAALLPLAL